MKIIKQGNIEYTKKILRFECDECKTIFEAEKNEYKYCGDQKDGDCWVATCPLCSNKVYSYGR